MSACVMQFLINLRKKKINGDISMKKVILVKINYLNIIDFSYGIEYSNIKNKAKIITNI